MSKPSLKSLNQPTLRWYIGSVIAGFAIIIGIANLSDLRLLVTSPERVGEPWRLIIPLASAGLYLFLARLIPTEWKEVMVFWRVSERLPGHRAFTVLAKKDSRVSLSRLRDLHGTLPRTGSKQNDLWYTIYNKYRDFEEVRDPHCSYLLYRELTYLNLAVGLFLLVPSFIAGLIPMKVALYVIGVVVLASVALALNARNAAKRMVQNALALESASR
jgi:hypothetical protein